MNRVVKASRSSKTHTHTLIWENENYSLLNREQTYYPSNIHKKLNSPKSQGRDTSFYKVETANKFVTTLDIRAELDCQD